MGKREVFSSRIKRENKSNYPETEDFHFHDLRHTFASHMIMTGTDITTVKELLGHKTLSMTMRYAHLAPSHKVKAVNMLDSVLNDKPLGNSSKLSTAQYGVAERKKHLTKC